MNNIAYNIKRLRMGKMLSQVGLASFSGLQPSQISNFETGRTTPSLKNLIKIADALNCSLDELVK